MTGRHTLEHAGTCWNTLERAITCWNVLEHAGTDKVDHAGTCWSMRACTCSCVSAGRGIELSPLDRARRASFKPHVKRVPPAWQGRGGGGARRGGPSIKQGTPTNHTGTG